MNQQTQQPRQPAGSQRSEQPPRGQMFPTQSYLDENTRRMSIEMLNQVLADATDLLTQLKFAHWNVRGQNFYQLHELFEEIAEVLEMHIDEIAERATALGGTAMGTARLAATASHLPEMPTDAVNGEEFLGLLAERLAILDSHLYDCIQRSSQQNDLDTADLLNEVSRDVAKQRWFLEAHLTTQPVGGQGSQTMGGHPPGGQSNQPQSGQQPY